MDFKFEVAESRKRSRSSTGSPCQEDEDIDRQEEILQPLSQTDNYAPPEPTQRRRRRTDLFGSEVEEDSNENDDIFPKVIMKGKRVHDRCHGSITLEPLLVRIMDTREFQRLRGLKQLGGSVFVYPDASHSRFEHSIGVAHLARLMVTRLRDQNPSLGIDDRDVTCVSLAGLVHDLGHGPFSHMFESFVNSNRKKDERFEHEEMSIKILRHLLENNNICFEDYIDYSEKNQADQDLQFVIELIRGLQPAKPIPKNVGRPEEKRFLFEIVSNQRNGIDVDKLDYFHRDASSAFGEKDYRVQTDRIIESVRVDVDNEGKSCIIYEEKNHLDILNIFKTRMHLHLTLYQHHVVNVIEKMIEDALAAAKDVKVVRGSAREDGGDDRYTLLEATNDVQAYIQLGDWILEFIEASPDEDFLEAQAIIRRLRVRELYRQAGPELVIKSASLVKETVHAMILEECKHLVEDLSVISGPEMPSTVSSSSSFATSSPVGDDRSHPVASDTFSPFSQIQSNKEQVEHSTPEFVPVTHHDVIVMEVRIDHGKDPIDKTVGYPLRHVLFYNPKQPDSKPKTISEYSFRSVQLPRSWGQLSFWVYVRTQDKAVNHTVSKAWETIQHKLITSAEFDCQSVQANQNQPSPAHHKSSAANSPYSRRRVSRDSAQSVEGSSLFQGGTSQGTSVMSCIVER